MNTTTPGMTARRERVTAVLLLLPCGAFVLGGAGCGRPEAEGLTRMFNGKDLTGWKMLEEDYYDAHGKVHVKDGKLMLESGQAMTGVAWKGDFPKDDFEVELEAMRVEGEDFFCSMTFPVATGRASLIVGGFGGMVMGISNVDNLAADENETTKVIEFKRGRWYNISLRVADGKIEAWLDYEKLIELPTAKRKFNVWPQMESLQPFGLATWYTTGALRNITLQRFGQ